MEFETRHLTMTVVITDSGKNRHWTLKQVGKSLLRKVNIPLVSKALPLGAHSGHGNGSCHGEA